SVSLDGRPCLGKFASSLSLLVLRVFPNPCTLSSDARSILTHLDWNPEATLIHFQGQYLTICELDYNILQGEIQNVPKAQARVDIGEFCLVEDVTSARWYRGRVQNQKKDLYDVFLIDHGNVLSVDEAHISSCTNDLFILPPKIVCGFLSSVLLLPDCCHSVVEQYFSNLIGRHVTGYIQALLPHKVLLLEAPDINNDLVRHGFGKHVDTDTFLLLVEMLTEAPLKQNIEPAPDLLIEKQRGQEFNLKPTSLKGYEEILSFCRPKLKCGSHATVHVTAAVRPELFYCQIADKESELKELSNRLAAVSEFKAKINKQRTPDNLGLLCSVKGKDDKWYRGFVQHLPINSLVRVLFVDYGYFESVEVENIHKLPPDFSLTPIMAFPSFALCCSLVNVVPNDEFWTISASDSYRRLLSNKELQVHVMAKRKTKFDVDLYLVEGGSVTSQSLSDLLIATNQAQYGKNISAQFRKKQKIYSTKMKGKQNNQPLQNTEKCENWAEETNVPKVQTEKSKEPVCLKALNIKPGSEFAVFCPLIHTPSDFWCQRLDNVPALEALLVKLQDHYSTKSVPLDPEALSCAVKAPNTSQWCRGIITERRNGQANVSLADFGSSIQVSEESLQGLLPEFCVLEGQAFRCSLYNVIEPPALGWTSEASEFLKTFVEDSGSSLKCKVISQLNVRNRWLCNVVHLNNTESDQSVSNLLLERSLARVVTTTLSPTVFPESFVFSSYDLNVGSEEPVHVTHVSSHFEVLCQLDKNSSILEEIDAKICEISKVEQADSEAVVDKLCLAKYLDGKWYRGIAYPAQSPSHLCVTFVDYGNTMIAEKKHVIFIPRDSTDLLYTPMQALKFTLAWVPQDLVFADVKEWLDAAVLNKLVRAVIEAKGEDGSFKVELFDGEVSINEKLKELIHSLTPKPKMSVTFKTKGKKARQIDNGRYKCKAKSSPTSNPQNKTNKNKANTNSQMNRAGAVKSPQMKKKQNRVTSAVDTNGEVSPAKSQTASTIEVKTETGKTCQPEQPTMFQVSCLPAVKLTEGLKLRCFVTYVDSLSSFYLQLSDDEANILKIVEDLNSRVFRDALKSTTNTILKVHDLVLAVYEEDGSLYRAVVKEAVGFCTFKVEFVDFGNSALMGKEKIYLITKDYITQPRYSIHCSLHDCSAFENSAAFTDAVMEKPLMVEFICYKKSQWEVKVEILGATTTSTPPETVAAKETEGSKENSTAPEVKRPFCVVLEDLPLMSQVSVLLEDIRDELEPLPRAHLIPGTGCLVKSESKKKWCRAEILHADSILTINLVDYGHDECLSYEDHSKLRKLPKCIAELPKVTYPCMLKAVRPVGAHGQWTDEAAIFFQQCLDQRNLQIFFREEVSKCQWKVDVLANGMHLAKQLVDAGHATYTDVMLGLR
uniref:Si:dkeyp-93d12.1 n=1 Tax=Neogobius melanostomus TaxID=47308 RepID=A0A8C6UGF8_9GOBI